MKLFLMSIYITDKIPVTISSLFTHNAMFKHLDLLSIHTYHLYGLP